MRISKAMLCMSPASVLFLTLLPAAVLGSSNSFPCLVKPQQIVAVAPSVVGTLDTVTVDQGDLVRTGDTIATLESSLERAQVAVARAKAGMIGEIQKTEQQWAFSKRKVARSKDLKRASAIAEHELDEAETEERVAQASYLEAKEKKTLAEEELKEAEAALALRTIRSPVSGIVIERLAVPGDLVKQTPIFRLAQVDPLRVEAYVPTALLGKIRPGMHADIRVDTPALGPYAGRVVGITPFVEPATATYGVRVEVQNPRYQIPIGIRCTATFAVE